MDFQVRKALAGDLSTVSSIFLRAIQTMDAQNIPQWDTLYPNEEVLSRDIADQNMYAITDSLGTILSVFVLNQEFDPGYANGNWEYRGQRFAILHRLCVDPTRQNQGIGSRTLRVIEKLAKKLGFHALRLDAFSLNPFALQMYQKAGYEKVGEVVFRKGLFYLFEKVL